MRGGLPRLGEVMDVENNERDRLQTRTRQMRCHVLATPWFRAGHVVRPGPRILSSLLWPFLRRGYRDGEAVDAVQTTTNYCNY